MGLYSGLLPHVPSPSLHVHPLLLLLPNAPHLLYQVLNDMMTVVKAGGGVGIPGLYVTEDPGAKDAAAKVRGEGKGRLF